MNWIDPKKQTPKEIGFTRCLVVSDTSLMNQVFEAFYNNKVGIFQDLGYAKIDVKWWMPLPEAPKALYDDEQRYFVDLRGGCGAIRDRLHPEYDDTYQGLHRDTIDVIEYKHGYRNSETKSWEMREEDIEFLNSRCASLNEAY